MTDDDYLDLWPDDAADAAPPQLEYSPVLAAAIGTPVMRAEQNPDVFRLAVEHRDDIAAWFRRTVDWQFEAYPLEGMIRLYKRRRDPPADRSVRLIRKSRAARRPAPTLVITLMCLVCEQLWRHPETGYNDLQRAIAQGCAAEAETGRLPRYTPASPDGQNKAKAQADRTALVDALRILADLGMIDVDRPLDTAERDSHEDFVITARRERLALLPACPSPTILPVDLDAPADHVRMLCSDMADLPEHASARQRDLRRRHVALRYVLDDPGVAPDTPTEAGAYLASAIGRRTALATAAAAGLVCTVRRDWWIIADPDGDTTDTEFPNGRSQEQQAAAVLLADLAARTEPAAPITRLQAAELLQAHMDLRPWWAAHYRSAHGPQRLAASALSQLVEAGVLTRDTHGTWTPTPAIHAWNIHILEQSAPTTDSRDKETTP